MIENCSLYVGGSKLVVKCNEYVWCFSTGHGLGRDMRSRFGLWDKDHVTAKPAELIEFLIKFYCRRGVATTIRPTPIIWWSDRGIKPHLLPGVDMLFTLIEETGYDTNILCKKLKRLYRRYKKGEVVRPNLIDWIG